MSATPYTLVYADEILVGDMLSIGGAQHNVYATHTHGTHNTVLQLQPLSIHIDKGTQLAELKVSSVMKFYVIRQ